MNVVNIDSSRLICILLTPGELEDPSFPGHANEYPGLVLKKKSNDIDQCPDTPANLTIGFEKGQTDDYNNQEMQ